MNSYIRILFCICIAGIMACEYPDQITRMNPLDPESSLLYAPTPPSDLNITVHSDTHIEIEWEINSLAESGFVVERKSEEEEEFSIIGTLDAGVNNFSDTSGIITDRYYDYRVGVFGEAQVKYYSEMISIFLEFPAPQNVSVTTIATDNVEITWDYEITFHNGFVIERKSIDDENFYQIAVLEHDKRSYIDNDLITDEVYAYNIYAITNINESYNVEFNIIFGPYDFTEIYTLNISRYSDLIAISNDRSIFVTNESGWPTLRNLNNGEIIHTFDDISAPVDNGISLSGDGTLLAFPHNQTTMGVWRTSDYQRFRTFSTFPHDITNSDISYDNHYLVIVSWPGYLTLWNISDWSLVNEIELEYIPNLYFPNEKDYIYVFHGGGITKLSVPDFEMSGRFDDTFGNHFLNDILDDLIVLAGNQFISILDFSSAEPVYKIYPSDTQLQINSVALRPPGNHVYIGSNNGIIYGLPIETELIVPVIRFNDGRPIESIKVSADGKQVVTRNSQGDLRAFKIGYNWSVL